MKSQSESSELKLCVFLLPKGLSEQMASQPKIEISLVANKVGVITGTTSSSHKPAFLVLTLPPSRVLPDPLGERRKQAGTMHRVFMQTCFSDLVRSQCEVQTTTQNQLKHSSPRNLQIEIQSSECTHPTWSLEISSQWAGWGSIGSWDGEKV